MPHTLGIGWVVSRVVGGLDVACVVTELATTVLVCGYHGQGTCQAGCMGALAFKGIRGAGRGQQGLLCQLVQPCADPGRTPLGLLLCNQRAGPQLIPLGSLPPGPGFCFLWAPSSGTGHCLSESWPLSPSAFCRVCVLSASLTSRL